MELPPQLDEDLGTLRDEGYKIETIPEGPRAYVIFREFHLPDGIYSQTATDLMMMADYQYPQSGMDMFWTDPPVTLKSGAYPQNAEQFEVHVGRRWQRWSWHYSGWDPARNSIVTHLDIVQDRLRRGH